MGILERMRLDGKAGFVTGGARGIGKSAAAALCEAGADIALVDLDLDEARRAAEWLRDQTGRRAIAIRANVTDPKDVDRMTGEVLAHFGRIDIAFCNAGIAVNAPAEDMTFDQWRRVIDVNLTGVFLTAQAAGRVMLAQGGGSIINTASMSGHIVNRPQPQCGYNASKAGVIQLTKSLAVEWAARGVRVNSISPGYIGTELILAAPQLKALIDEWNADAPLHRLGRPDELQALVVYLAGDASSFTTGSDFIVDGAFTCV
ncbi:MAG: SDR family oxidoreductase [Clostridiales bacterium]|nr:SDR family oxidoreductase [Clostridiales bacterium]